MAKTKRNLLNVFGKLNSLQDLILTNQLGYLNDDITVINKFSRAELANNVLSLASSFNNLNPFLDTPTELYLSSSDVRDTQAIKYYYMDFDYNLQESEATLTGQTAVSLGNNIRSIWRMENDGSSDLSGTVSIGSEAVPAGGVPTANNTYCNIPLVTGISANQSLTSVFSVPAGYSAIVYAPIVGVQKNGDVIAGGFIREFGKTFKYKLGLSAFESISEKNNFIALAQEKSDLMIKAFAQTGAITFFEYGVVLINNNSLESAFDV